MRLGKRDQPLYRRDRQVWIVLVDFFERRSKLGVLNYGVRKNAGAADYRTADTLPGTRSTSSQPVQSM